MQNFKCDKWHKTDVNTGSLVRPHAQQSLKTVSSNCSTHLIGKTLQTSEEINKLNIRYIYRRAKSKNYGKCLFINSESEKKQHLWKTKKNHCQSRIIYPVSIMFKINLRSFGNTETESDIIYQPAGLHYHTHGKEMSQQKCSERRWTSWTRMKERRLPTMGTV